MKQLTPVIRHSGLAAMCLLSGLASATPPAVLDQGSFWLGVYGPDVRGDAVFAGAGAGGTARNIKNDFGGTHHHELGRLHADYLTGDMQGVVLDYYQHERKGNVNLDQQVLFNGTNYNPNAGTSARFKLDLGKAAYQWWLQNTDMGIFGVGAGVGYMRVKASYSGPATVSGSTVNRSDEVSRERWAPLVSLNWRQAINPATRVYAGLAGMHTLDSKDRAGRAYTLDVGAEYYPWRNVGFGAEYAYSRVKIADKKSDFDGSVDANVDGPLLYIKARF